MRAPKAVLDDAGFGKYVDYAAWFTDSFCKDYVGMLAQGHKSASAGEKNAVFAQLEQAMALYAILVYRIYPNRPEFRKGIDSDPKLSANFKAVRQWLDQNGGQQTADEVLGLFKSYVSQRTD